MSRDALHAFFLELLKTTSAAHIARETGYTDAAISQVRHNKYEADDTIILKAIFAKFGRWDCPALNIEINLEQCHKEASKPYSAGRIQQWALCQKCERRS